jgi:isocitrate lyase
MSFKHRVKAVSKWLNRPRFKNVARTWNAEQIVTLQGSQKPVEQLSNRTASKFWDLMEESKKNKKCEYTFGALDPLQVTQMSQHLSTVYVSGWQTSSTASSNNLPGPDLADYPYDSVPKKVDQLFRSQIFHDRKQFERNRRMPESKLNIDYFRPIIADADAGHGGPSTVMKLTQMFVEAGAAGIHIEDQKNGAKKCGHQGGKVLCSMQEQISRLKAARLQCDIMGTDTVIIGRTDAKSAKFIDSDIDPVDIPFIRGQSGSKVDKYDLKKYGLDSWLPDRTPEGYYHVDCGLDLAIARANAMAPYADVLWCELDTPSLEDARTFAEGVDKKNAFLAINTSPSFNWASSGLTIGDMKEYHKQLGEMGYQWSFITLAGFHLNGLATAQFSRDYKDNSMFAYVNNIQDKEKDMNLDILTHQQFSGSELIDTCLTTALGDSYSTQIQGDDSTEHQFKN